MSQNYLLLLMRVQKIRRVIHFASLSVYIDMFCLHTCSDLFNVGVTHQDRNI